MNRLDTVTMRDLLPPNFQYDPDAIAASKAISPDYFRLYAAAPGALIFAGVDHLAEPWLDLLALDLHIDYYDTTLSVEQKRDLVRQSIAIHQKKGTPWALEEMVRIVFGEARIEEWFDYEGAAFRFRIAVDVEERGLGLEDRANLIRVVRAYKNARSHLEQLRIMTRSEATVQMAALSGSHIVTGSRPSVTRVASSSGAVQAGMLSGSSMRTSSRITPTRSSGTATHLQIAIGSRSYRKTKSVGVENYG